MQPDRSCQVAVSTNKVFLSPVVSSDRSAEVACGSRERAWLLEAPSGQRVNISLLDFSAGSSSSSSSGDVQQRARTVETASSRCVRQFGFIEDKSQPTGTSTSAAAVTLLQLTDNELSTCHGRTKSILYFTQLNRLHQTSSSPSKVCFLGDRFNSSFLRFIDTFNSERIILRLP